MTQKFGLIPKNLVKSRSNIWLHAVSYGEVKTVQPLVQELLRSFPEHKLFLSTGTETGQKLANELFSQEVRVSVFYCPFDFFFAVKSWLKAIDPEILVIAETELWPELITQASQHGCRCFLVNARLTDRSVERYKLLRPIFQNVLGQLTGLYAQSQADRQRFLAIGAKPEVEVLDNLKFDNALKLTDKQRAELKLLLNIKPSSKVLILGSSHEPEEKILCEVFKDCLEKKPQTDFRLIIVPRHLERLEQIKTVIKSLRLPYRKFSELSEKVVYETREVLLVDQMGQLGKLYGVADLAFLGGTWAKVGGHNPLEPAVYNIPIVVGPHTYKIAELVEYLNEKQLITQVSERPDYDGLESLLFNNKSQGSTEQTKLKTVSKEITERILKSIQ